MVTDPSAYHFGAQSRVTPTAAATSALHSQSPSLRNSLSPRFAMGSSKRAVRPRQCRWAGLLVTNIVFLGLTFHYLTTGPSRGASVPTTALSSALLSEGASASSVAPAGASARLAAIAAADKPAATDQAPALRSRLDWAADDEPAFCGALRDFPQPHVKNCSTADPVPGTPKCDPSKPMMYSQYGEDYFLYTRHFSKLRRRGVYLDIATNDPIMISNTYFFDRCLGWSGVCVEANPKYFERIHRERSCALVPTCVSSRDGAAVEFALSGPGSGIVSTHRQGSAIAQKAAAVVKLRCVSVMKQLRRYGVRRIDYLNLDVEGHELDVLRGFDFDAVRVGVISVEVPNSQRDEIFELLAGSGFTRLDTTKSVGGMEGMEIYRSNEFFVHSSVEFGRPE